MSTLGSALIAVLVLLPMAAQADDTDASMAGFFSVWAHNADVTRDEVARQYAERVVYYGKTMTNAEVYADKLAYIRRWPDRQYKEVPGSATRGCEPGKVHCFIGVILAYDVAGRGRRSSGRSQIRLTLARSGGQWKIVKESGRALE